MGLQGSELGLFKACAPFAAAEGIAIAFGRMSSTDDAEVVKTPAGAVNSRCCIKSGYIGMHGNMWQAWA